MGHTHIHTERRQNVWWYKRKMPKRWKSTKKKQKASLKHNLIHDEANEMPYRKRKNDDLNKCLLIECEIFFVKR